MSDLASNILIRLVQQGGEQVRNILNGLGNEMTTLSSRAGNMGMAMQNVGQGITNVGRQLTEHLTKNIIGAGVAMVKTAMDFEEQMSFIKAVTAASSKEMKQFNDLAIEMGIKTKYSALEAAKGIEELAKAGMSTTDILHGGLEGSLALAAAGELELADASKTTAVMMNVFSDEGMTAMRAADLLAGAANSSATGVAEISISARYAASAAAVAGVKMKDFATALAMMAQKGLEASNAGTAMRTFILNLMPTTDKAADLMKSLGIITADNTNRFFDANGKVKGLSEVINILNTSMSKLTTPEKMQAIKTLFGKPAYAGVVTLLKEGSAGFEKMAASIEKIKAVDVAAEKMNNLKGKIEILQGSIETLSIVWGAKFQTPLKKVVELITKLINKFIKLDPLTQNIIIGVALLVAATGPAIMIFGTLTTIVGGIVAAFAFLGSGIIFATGGIVALMAVLSGLVVGFIALILSSEDLRNAIKEKFDFIVKKIKDARDWVKIHIDDIKAVIKGLVDYITTGNFDQSFDLFRQALYNMFPLKSHAEIDGWIQDMINFRETIISVRDKIIDFADKVVKKFTEISESEGFKNLIKNLKEFGPQLLATIGSFIDLMGKAISIINGEGKEKKGKGEKPDYMQTLADAIGLINTLLGMAQSIFDFFNSVQTMGDNASKAIDKFVKDIEKFFTDLYNSLIGESIIPDIINGIVLWFTGLPGKVIGTISGFVTSVLNKFGELKDSATTKFNELKDSIVNKLSEIADGALDWGKKIIDGLIDGLSSRLESVKKAAKNIAQAIKDFFPSSPAKEGPLKSIPKWMPSMIDMMTKDMQNGIGKISGYTENLASAINPSKYLQATPYVSSSNNNSNQSINIVVNGANMDINQIGTELVKQLRIKGAIK